MEEKFPHKINQIGSAFKTNDSCFLMLCIYFKKVAWQGKGERVWMRTLLLKKTCFARILTYLKADSLGGKKAIIRKD